MILKIKNQFVAFIKKQIYIYICMYVCISAFAYLHSI